MEKYNVTILSTAQEDLLSIVDYLNTLEPATAIKYYDLIVSEILKLEEMPERCPLCRDVGLKAKGYRFLLIKNYIAFYVIKGKTVEIRRILYAKRQYETLLK